MSEVSERLPFNDKFNHCRLQVSSPIQSRDFYRAKWISAASQTLFFLQDFVDVTLACADGSTIAAHKVILSSVSTYFRDILKVSLPSRDKTLSRNNYYLQIKRTIVIHFLVLVQSIRSHQLNHSCFQNAASKHPIIILKDTIREELQAMLEFAYTGQVRRN